LRVTLDNKDEAWLASLSPAYELGKLSRPPTLFRVVAGIFRICRKTYDKNSDAWSFWHSFGVLFSFCRVPQSVMLEIASASVGGSE
jgi:hypothetical protein